MQNIKKVFLSGIAIGVAAASIAIAFAIRAKQTTSVHLFVLEGQEDAEEKIEDMLPKEPKTSEKAKEETSPLAES